MPDDLCHPLYAIHVPRSDAYVLPVIIGPFDTYDAALDYAAKSMHPGLTVLPMNTPCDPLDDAHLAA
jgi:hypothetical protein